MSCGFSQAGVKILGGIDIEKAYKETYTLNHPGTKFLNKDITKYEPIELRSELGLQKFDNDLIFIGCSPCQYWSKINTIKHQSSYTSNLLSDFERFIKYFLPGYVVVENVPGILKNNNNHHLLNFLDFLVFNGYRYDHRLVKTNRYGVPQNRRRFLLIASRVHDIVDFPCEDENNTLTVRNFIGVDNGFKKIGDGVKDRSEFLHITSKLSDLNKRRIELTPHDGGSRDSWANDPKLQIPAYDGKDNIFRSIYGRLNWDKPSATITTRFNAISCGRFGHPDEDRGLSLREGATLQTFPKSYKFRGSMVSIAKQIGNAVPPEMARRIAKKLTEIHLK